MLRAGDGAPDFRLQSDTGETLDLDALRGGKAVLFFYPRDNTSG